MTLKFFGEVPVQHIGQDLATRSEKSLYDSDAQRNG
jgi:hypothetical protein